jgi:hypothetical protein
MNYKCSKLQLGINVEDYVTFFALYKYTNLPDGRVWIIHTYQLLPLPTSPYLSLPLKRHIQRVKY